MNLKYTERDAWRMAHCLDGLIDIFLGAVFLWFSINIFLNWDNLGLAIMALLVAGHVLAKKYVIGPRLGHVKFGRVRRKKVLKANLLLFGSAMLGGVFLLLSKFSFMGLPEFSLVAVILPITILVVLGLLAWYTDFPRLYLYAVMLAISFAVFVMIKEAAGVRTGAFAITATSVFMVCVGAVNLFLFLKRYRTPHD
ncbi:MAG: hypothetical protein ABH879_00445 [archaeon]